MPVHDVLVFAYGNPSRGDDALGPSALDHLADCAHPGIELLGDFQLQVEHALDLEQRRLVLFIDADASCSAPFRFIRLQPARDRSYTTHAMSPAAVLQVFEDLRGEPPPCFLLGIRGYRFELGEPLSEAARANLEAAARFLDALCVRPDPTHWQSLSQLKSPAVPA
ncbi:hydrogenase maturation protease [Methyloterricola oryzae]|uniref:hydrogenase maturation protease n=1 Tax=Methyloterricola oryzae TaxID=1495050 RepID=UPI0005EB2FF1|nr:hydrogenase maturation protease [Methyloterricola oryzae]